MDQINGTVECDVGHLYRQPAKLFARQGASYVLAAKRIPGDLTQVFLRVFRPDGAYHDIMGNEHPFYRSFYVIGTCFPQAGEAYWEIHATDARGNPTAVASGPLVIHPFSAGGVPVKPGDTIPVCQIPTPDGAMVQVQMVKDETGHWTYQAITGD